MKTERIQNERQQTLEKMGISIQDSGIKVEKNKFYLVNLNADPCLNELLVYYLKVCIITRPALTTHILHSLDACNCRRRLLWALKRMAVDPSRTYNYPVLEFNQNIASSILKMAACFWNQSKMRGLILMARRSPQSLRSKMATALCGAIIISSGLIVHVQYVSLFDRQFVCFY